MLISALDEFDDEKNNTFCLLNSLTDLIADNA